MSGEPGCTDDAAGGDDSGGGRSNKRRRPDDNEDDNDNKEEEGKIGSEERQNKMSDVAATTVAGATAKVSGSSLAEQVNKIEKEIAMLEEDIAARNDGIDAKIRIITQLETALFADDNAKVDSLWKKLGFDEGEQEKPRKLRMYLNQVKQELNEYEEEVKECTQKVERLKESKRQLEEEQQASFVSQADGGGKAKDFSGLVYTRGDHTVHLGGELLTTSTDDQYKFGGNIDRDLQNIEANMGTGEALNKIFVTDEDKKLKSLLDEKLFNFAKASCDFRRIEYSNVGERFCQQYYYTPFSMLLASANMRCMSLSNYAGNEEITCSLRCKYKTNNSTEENDGVVRCRPDGATMIQGKWDPFAMMEIKPSSDPEIVYTPPYEYDRAKCILAVTSTAILLSKMKMQKENIVLPFLIGTQHVAHLYVVCFHHDRPKVKYVMRGVNLTINKPRLSLFAALALLLARFKQNYTDSDCDYDPFVAALGYGEKGVSVFSTTKQKSETNTRRSGDSKSSQQQTGGGGGGNKEELACQAAGCDGTFTNVKYPWVRVLYFGRDTEDVIQYQTKSPYYFRGVHASTGKDTFLKVFRDGEIDMKGINEELSCLRRAADHDIPVAALVVDKVIEVCVDSTKFYVLATEHMDTSDVAAHDIERYAASLISAVKDLHDKAGVLHCDIKPDNILWDATNKCIRLIDFGHSQLESNAKWYHATEKYEAPEIQNRQSPHSRKTDAYSVGATILRTINKYNAADDESSMNGRLRIIHDIAINLTVEDPMMRWSLEQSLSTLQKEP